MLFSFLKKQRRNEALSLLIDVGSASVGAALVSIKEDNVPHILMSSREDILFHEKLSPASFLRSMGQALDRVLKTAQSKSKDMGAPKHIFCSLSSPWFMLKSRHVDISQKEPFEVTPETLNKILGDEVELLKKELQDMLPLDDMKIMEKNIIQTKLNGYEIKNPYGQKASHVKLAMTVGISSKQIAERVERSARNFFHAKLVHFGAFPVAALSAIRDIFPTHKSFLFLDITGEATDVSLVNNDLLVGTVSFPRGKNFFIREISVQLRIPHDVAVSVLNMFFGDTLDLKRQEEVRQIMMQAEKDWTARFEKSFLMLGSDGALSRKVFFMADADISPFFLQSLSKSGIGKGTLDVQYLDHAILGKFAVFGAGVVRDPFVITEALLAAKVVPQLK